MNNLKPTYLHSNIVYYENVIKNIDTLVDRIERSDALINEYEEEKYLITKWKKWEPGDGYLFGHQKRLNDNIKIEYSSPLYPELSLIVADLENAIIDCSSDYSRNFNLDIGVLSPISISKYQTGAMMGKHVDSYDDNGIETISVVVYINDDYVGGEIEFPEQNIKIKPSAGSVVVFPSKKPYFHISHIVESGKKYMSPGFWRKSK
jgi:hypothetical protein